MKKVMENTKNWIKAEAVATHEDGHTTYARVWFNEDEIVAIEPYSIGDLGNGEVGYHYHNRIMGPEVLEYGIELLD